MPRTTRHRRNPGPANPPSDSNTTATTTELPDGLVDLPATFRGGDRDRFHDIAPAGGVLVGARVSYIMRFGGPKISSFSRFIAWERSWSTASGGAGCWEGNDGRRQTGLRRRRHQHAHRADRRRLRDGLHADRR